MTITFKNHSNLITKIAVIDQNHNSVRKINIKKTLRWQSLLQLDKSKVTYNLTNLFSIKMQAKVH